MNINDSSLLMPGNPALWPVQQSEITNIRLNDMLNLFTEL